MLRIISLSLSLCCFRELRCVLSHFVLGFGPAKDSASRQCQRRPAEGAAEGATGALARGLPQERAACPAWRCPRPSPGNPLETLCVSSSVVRQNNLHCRWLCLFVVFASGNCFCFSIAILFVFFPQRKFHYHSSCSFPPEHLFPLWS